MSRIGQGFDVHRLVEGRPLVLGGITIPSPKGLEGYSDADVLTHAVIDALLGALGLGDIGQHFPSGDPRYRGISSVTLLQQALERVVGGGWQITNLDATLLMEVPRLGPFLGQMRSRLAEVLNLPNDRVNVKAVSPEGLGFVGRGEGIAALAVVLLDKNDGSFIN
ncbi:MAG: 2-C-methyl-D-erythritol 2,4-cyclodiphosphate synthase [Chloroflexi bacterium]|nr:2-C-methyl-D-erythritol 2,4-cyclodiphosphate synthase [Chloroflexota bacterium]